MHTNHITVKSNLIILTVYHFTLTIYYSVQLKIVNLLLFFLY